MSSEQQEVQQQQQEQPIQQQEPEKQQDVASVRQPEKKASVGLKYDIELEKDTEKDNLKTVVIRGPAGEQSFGLFNTKRGRELVFTNILQALEKKTESANKQIQLSASSSAIYILLHAITELQHEKKITVISTQNLTNIENQQVLATIAVL